MTPAMNGCHCQRGRVDVDAIKQHANKLDALADILDIVRRSGVDPDLYQSAFDFLADSIIQESRELYLAIHDTPAYEAGLAGGKAAP